MFPYSSNLRFLVARGYDLNVVATKQEVGKRLRRRLRDAHRAYMEALARLGALDQPAGGETRAAHQRYMVVLQQCRDFALSGAFPDDLFPTE